jgi:TolB protein
LVHAAAVVALVLLCVPAAHAAFPGQNGKVAYTLLVDSDPNDGVLSGQGDVFTTTPGQFYRTNLTNNSPEFETNPSWSADGKRMVAKISSPSGNSGLFLMDANGGIVDFVGRVSGGHFAVLSPDGTRIAFGEAPSSNDNNYEVSVINVDGTGYTNLTKSPGVDLSPSWSPDGTRIAFNSARASGSDIYTMNADGSDVVRVTTSGLNLDPDWSPDGTRLAFMDASVDGDIHVINADGTGEVNLGTPGYDRQPAWSPDGTKIAFLSRLQGSHDEIYVMNADGSGATQATWSESAAGAPSWQPILPDEPVCSYVSVWPRSLKPADRRFVKVRLSAPTDGVTINVTGVTQDEPVGAVPDALRRPTTDRVLLRAQHKWTGDGRVYQVAFTASDGQGGECTGVVEVEVRRYESTPAVDSAPPSYDSFAPDAAR